MTSITLIHGMYVTVDSWQPWLDRAKAAGIDAKTVEWPGHDGAPGELRAHVRPELRTLNYAQLVDLHAEAIGDEDTILVGHSIGGLLVQSLLARGVGTAGVAICPAPPQGTLSLRGDFLRANLPHTFAHKRSTPLEMDKERWRYCFANTLSPEAADAAWEQFCVPESRAVPLGHFYVARRREEGGDHAAAARLWREQGSPDPGIALQAHCAALRDRRIPRARGPRPSRSATSPAGKRSPTRSLPGRESTPARSAGQRRAWVVGTSSTARARRSPVRCS